MRTQTHVAALVLVALLTACSGGDEGSNNVNPQAAFVSSVRQTDDARFSGVCDALDQLRNSGLSYNQARDSTWDAPDVIDGAPENARTKALFDAWVEECPQFTGGW
jgi:hypothetical protein